MTSQDNIFKITTVLAVSFFTGILLLAIGPIIANKLILVLLFPVVLSYLIVLVTNPKMALLILLFSRPVLEPVFNASRFFVMGQYISLGALFNVLIILIALGYWLHYPKMLQKNGFVMAWLVFIAIMLVSAFHSDYTGRALRLLINYLSYMAMAILPWFLIHSHQDKNKYLDILVYSSIVTVRITNIDLVSNGFIFRPDGRLQGPFSHPNILGFYSLLMIVVIFLIHKSQGKNLKGFKSILFKAIGLNCLIFLILTQTRNAWIACWCFFLGYGLLRNRKYVFWAKTF